MKRVEMEFHSCVKGKKSHRDDRDGGNCGLHLTNSDHRRSWTSPTRCCSPELPGFIRAMGLPASLTLAWNKCQSAHFLTSAGRSISAAISKTSISFTVNFSIREEVLEGGAVRRHTVIPPVSRVGVAVSVFVSLVSLLLDPDFSP
jgi:hypothetical protein